jgi:hypothetical protein
MNPTDNVFLPHVKLSSRANQYWTYSGKDSPEQNRSESFYRYPQAISYRYNSRGFRDAEWPTDIGDLRSSTWCIGDSFTVGLGVPLQNTWPHLLQDRSGTRCINVSMDGASNEWMVRMAQDIIREINPKQMVIMWSYLSRREDADTTKTDEDRRIWLTRASDDEDIANFLSCVDDLPVDVACHHFLIPNAHVHQNHLGIWDKLKGPDWPLRPKDLDGFAALPKWLVRELKAHGVYRKLKRSIAANQTLLHHCEPRGIIMVDQLDFGRDGYHFDVKTAETVVDQILRVNR